MLHRIGALLHAAIHNRSNRQRGQSLVEFALICPLFFFLIIGLMEFSQIVRHQLTITWASRDAARYAAANPIDDAPILTQARNQLLAINPDRVIEYRIYKADTNGNVVVENGTSRINRYGPANFTTPLNLCKGNKCWLEDPNQRTRTYTAYYSGGNVTYSTTDIIGVEIVYKYNFIILQMFGNGPIVLTDRTTMRIEPLRFVERDPGQPEQQAHRNPLFDLLAPKSVLFLPLH